MRTSIIFVIFFSLVGRSLQSQEVAAITLETFVETIPAHEFLSTVIEQRSKPVSYEMEFRIRRNVLEKSNAKDSPLYGSLAETTGIIRVDELAGVSFVESTSKLLQAVSTDAKAEPSMKERYDRMIAPGMRLILPDREFVCDPMIGKIIERKNAREEYQGAPLFDFRNFGWAIEYDIRQGRTVEEVLKLLKKNLRKELYFSVDKNGIATLDLGDEETRVDTSRGYWPIERKTWSSMIKEKRYVSESVKIALEEFEGEWLPKHVDWIVEGKKSQKSEGYDFKWISYDKTIDPDKMDVIYMHHRLLEYREEKESKAKK